jgi:hypothetical protein
MIITETVMQHTNSKSKTDTLFQELATHMRAKQSEQVAGMIADILADTKVPSISTQLISFYIDYYATYALSPNVYMVELFATGIRNLLAIPKKHTRQLNSIEAFINVARTLMAIKVHTYNFISSDVLVDVSTLEALLANFGDKRYPELEFLSEQGMVTQDMYRLLNVMYYHVYRVRDKKTVLDIINYIFQSKTLALDEIVDTIDPVRGAIKFGKNDIVWYMWKILQLLTTTRKFDCMGLDARLVDTSLILFATFFQKKNRSTRINMIAYIFAILSSKNMEKRLIDTPVKVSHETGEQGRELERELEQERARDREQSTKGAQKQNTKPVATDTSSLASTENMDYLKCFTVINRDMIDAIRVERQSASAKQQVIVKMV